METAMKKIPLLAIALIGLALSACAPRYYERDGYHERYAPARGYYSNRDHYYDRHYSDNPGREYHDRRYDRDDN